MARALQRLTIEFIKKSPCCRIAFDAFEDLQTLASVVPINQEGADPDGRADQKRNILRRELAKLGEKQRRGIGNE
ncbi:hypothetical protein L580_3365 [Serratia fonticola AU-P3(3)]|nr:hypothetical protein L580_3365 [Serratia fonticola AU-P3(3)]